MRDPTTGLPTYQVPAWISAQLRGTFIDAAGTVVQPTELTLTVADVRTGAIIAGRRHTNVLNTAGVEVLNGQLAWSITPAELPLLDPRLDYEDHVAQFHFVVGGRASRCAVVFRVTPW